MNRSAAPGSNIREEPALQALVEQLRRRHHDAIEAVLVYGSCLRSGELFDGLVDVYLLCRSYREAYRSRRLALANRLLPPNVFFYRLDHGQGTLRCKVAVISLRDFSEGCTAAWFQSYIWGRFAQPTAIVYARDASVRKEVEKAMAQAAATLLERSLPALEPRGDVLSLWERALSLSYSTELRTERAGRARELVSAAGAFYSELTCRQAPALRIPLALWEEDGALCYRSRAGRVRRSVAPLAWLLRRIQGKCLSVLRLVKALFTFEGGLDYIVWKLQRHSGQEIEIPARVRRRPLLFAWGFFWRLYRRGVFR